MSNFKKILIVASLIVVLSLLMVCILVIFKADSSQYIPFTITLLVGVFVNTFIVSILR